MLSRELLITGFTSIWLKHETRVDPNSAEHSRTLNSTAKHWMLLLRYDWISLFCSFWQPVPFGQISGEIFMPYVTLHNVMFVEIKKTYLNWRKLMVSLWLNKDFGYFVWRTILLCVYVVCDSDDPLCTHSMSQTRSRTWVWTLICMDKHRYVNQLSTQPDSRAASGTWRGERLGTVSTFSDKDLSFKQKSYFHYWVICKWVIHLEMFSSAKCPNLQFYKWCLTKKI